MDEDELDAVIDTHLDVDSMDDVPDDVPATEQEGTTDGSESTDETAVDVSDDLIEEVEEMPGETVVEEYNIDIEAFEPVDYQVDEQGNVITDEPDIFDETSDFD